MPNPYFKFKQFTVWHDKTAMKVGTDGVLLGAWALVEKGDSVLDIGTGTGLIALMMAQRGAHFVDAVEIELSAYNQSVENVSLSPWNAEIQIIHHNIVEYSLCNTKLYKRIISNPPFFNQSLKSPLNERNIARHADSLPWNVLIEVAWKMLHQQGSFSVVLPWPDAKQFLQLANIQGFYESRVCLISPFEGKLPNRVMLEFVKYSINCEYSNLYIRGANNEYTDNYKTITSDFYLAF